MNNLVAEVTFTDVDGNQVCKKYSRNRDDLNDLLDYVNYKLTDTDHFPPTKTPVEHWFNGIADITKKITIVISPQ